LEILEVTEIGRKEAEESSGLFVDNYYARFVYGNNGGRFPAGGKGVRRPGPVEDGEKVLLS